MPGPPLPFPASLPGDGAHGVLSARRSRGRIEEARPPRPFGAFPPGRVQDRGAQASERDAR